MKYEGTMSLDIMNNSTFGMYINMTGFMADANLTHWPLGDFN